MNVIELTMIINALMLTILVVFENLTIIDPNALIGHNFSIHIIYNPLGVWVVLRNYCSLKMNS